MTYLACGENELSRSENTHSAATDESCTNKTKLHASAQAELVPYYQYFQLCSCWKATYYS